jgi:NAD(P)-dependent dehydrogenase (short-subunit alcohol dehydrogenase family)
VDAAATPGNSLENKVVIVTGAGRGIGREVALLAAAEGASVVVNDPGVGTDGIGSDAGPAGDVVEEIKAACGTAVVSTDSVADKEGARNLVATAMDRYGRLDAVVNNAGILRDKIFHQLAPEDFEAVIAVHLMGSFYVSREAATVFRKQEGGVFVHFTSTSGLIGNYGQSNYAAAKMGIVGLSKSIALDMARYGVRSNCIAPFAWTRMIGTIPEGRSGSENERVDQLKAMSAAQVAPLAVFLASPLSDEVTGQIFGVRGNEVFVFSQPRPLRSVHRDGGWTPLTLTQHALPALRSSFYALERSPDVFSWDPV